MWIRDLYALNFYKVSQNIINIIIKYTTKADVKTNLIFKKHPENRKPKRLTW